MTNDIDTLATALYVRTDDLLKQYPDLAPWRPAIGLQPRLSDAELVTLAVMRALLGFASEARWVRCAHAHLGHLFGYLPGQPGYNPTSATIWRWAILQFADLWVRCWRSLKLRTRPRRRHPSDGLIRLQRRASQPAAEGISNALGGNEGPDDQVARHDGVVASASLASSSSPSRFALQFDAAQIPILARRYSYPREERLVSEIGPAVRDRGYYTRAEFLEVCEWKTARSKSRAAKNTEDEVREATRLALSVTAEPLRIWIPMALSGVSWPTASVLLHFGHHDRYPILDVRALEALGVTQTVLYTLAFWSGYVAACRKIDDETGYGMRTIDRALWQWSKERSGSR